MNYSTLNGLTSKLRELKNKITTLKSKCNSEILLLDEDHWSEIDTYLQEIVNQITDAIENWPTDYGSKMQQIDTAVKSK